MNMQATTAFRFEHAPDLHPGDELWSLSPVVFDWAPATKAQVAAETEAEAARDLIDYRCAVVVLDGDEWVAATDVTFNERVRSATRSQLTGVDLSDSFVVQLEADLPPSRLQLRFRYRPAAQATPAELLTTIKLFEALAPDRRLGLWSHRTKRWMAAPIAIPPDYPRLPHGYAETVAALARVQKGTGQRFPMPAEINKDDATALRQAATLLAGQTVSGRWTTANLVIDAHGVEFLESAAAENGARLEFTAEYTVDIAGNTVILATAQHRLLQARVRSVTPLSGSDDREVLLVPGDDDRFEIRLATASDAESAAELEAYAGKWIAQSGSEIVASGSSPADVVQELRHAGATGAIWRVPATREEAEAVTAP